MDELQISGKRFISARRIARENGYTSDYIGQLIRGGKIVGQKVGRAWYVDAASFDRYLGSEVAAAPEIEEAVPSEPAAAPVAEPEPEPEPAAISVEEAEEELPAVAAEAEPVEEEAAVESEKENTEAADIAEEEREEEPMIAAVVEEKTVAPEVLSNMPSATVSAAPVAQRIPLRITKKEETASSSLSTAGLRYYADDLPALPEIVKTHKESRTTAEKDGASSVAMKETSARRHRWRRAFPGAGLLVAGVAVFVFFAIVSSAVSLNLSIQEGNAAAATYSIGW